MDAVGAAAGALMANRQHRQASLATGMGPSYGASPGLGVGAGAAAASKYVPSSADACSAGARVFNTGLIVLCILSSM